MKRFEGSVFRPPSEGGSLIIQATIGCSHNRCRFCTMYKDKQFRIKSTDKIIEELKEVEPYSFHYKRLFLGDGDAMGMPTKDLLKILRYIREEMPGIERVGVYAHGKNLLEKSMEELKELRANGLGIVYVGLESGSEEVLQVMDKGISVEECIKGSVRAKEAGMELSVMLISGLGGKRFLREHAVDSARAVSRIDPTYLSFLSVLVEENSGISEDIANGRFQLLEAEEALEESRIFLEEVDLEDTIFRSNHTSDYLPLEGVLGRDRDKLLRKLSNVIEKKKYR